MKWCVAIAWAWGVCGWIYGIAGWHFAQKEQARAETAEAWAEVVAEEVAIRLAEAAK